MIQSKHAFNSALETQAHVKVHITYTVYSGFTLYPFTDPEH